MISTLNQTQNLQPKKSSGSFRITPLHPADDPNEAYDVMPMPGKPYGPSGWWIVTRNGIPVRHFAPGQNGCD
jgi:hypothetical protein